jgi:primosomal protein N' (replication factor Y)
MNSLVQIAIPSPLYGLFDYRWKHSQPIIPGLRVSVPFGRRSVTGVVVGEIAKSEVPENKLRAVYKVYDSEPVLPSDLMALLQWASRYYHHPLGEVLSAALPNLLRQGKAAELIEQEFFRWIPETAESQIIKGAAVQQQLLDCLRERDGQLVPAAVLRVISPRWRSSLKSLMERGWVSTELIKEVPNNKAVGSPPVLLDEQAEAVTAIQRR